ncbi:hypothetical protein FOMAKNOH_01680 [Mannheimia haemolytica]|uniref:DUF2730 domain-containing protein n=1 Tax=Mannheimia haemolytica TaxID=75985 RepID=UPI0001BCF7DF|nr:DUF2730 domain-containing protein [Mannheimia haemolytica]EEY08694.1 Mu-like phage gp25 [Mannheimia haemolytica serotype A2 str. OVINE]EPZ00558.1 hypothetical protein L278_00830 [Mannheimia haemolytica D35]MDW0617355.1 DUF2730 domain-containing protein [Mannheimia haemolytica]MDW0723577.1 DUF2730 domain-containing protein [Mannheimia haemolytica]MDW0736608.1 DUF2730 domain-containing protein [Mannheimia haemolytica]
MIEVFEVIKAHWGIILTLFGLFASVFWLKLDSRYAKKNDIGKLLEVAQNHEGRLSGLETKVDNLPTAVDMERLKTLVTDVKGDTKATGKQVDSISHQLGLLIEAKLKE